MIVRITSPCFNSNREPMENVSPLHIQEWICKNKVLIRARNTMQDMKSNNLFRPHEKGWPYYFDH